MKRARVGIVGWGGRSGAVAAGLGIKATGGLMQPVVCVDPIDENYAMGCARFGLKPKRYDSVKEMVTGEQLDGIMIGSPNACHMDNLQECAGGDLPILLEKPLDSTFEKICNVVRFARSYDGPILVGHCMRFAPIAREAKKLLNEGRIGKICSVRFVQNCHYGNGGYHNWRRKKETSGTWLIEKSTHDFDIMLSLLEDTPDSVVAIQKLQAFGGDKSATLRCRDCDERVTCPESVQNISFRSGSYQVEELVNADDLCAFSKVVDTPDNDLCMIDFKSGVFGSYTQWFFSPRSYHHRVYEIHGTEGAMEVDFGAEFGGKITVCPRFGTLADRLEYKFDYLGRNHYNGDGNMSRHFYQIMLGNEKPECTVEQAFIAELLGYAAICSAEQRRFVSMQELIPDDLADLLNQKVY